MHDDAIPPPRSSGLDLSALLVRKRVIICVGSGGVGKTTTAASLGLLAAKQGLRTLVMTIDPARRLAAALGLHGGLNHSPRPVPSEKMASIGLQPDLLHAMMLEPKHTFDEMVRRYAPDPATVDTLLDSRLYQQISSHLAGAQEYAAMEMLYALFEENRYDLLVLDTPPAQNAMDFLDAPQKMVEAVQSPVVSMFIKTYESAGRLSQDMLGFSASYVVRRLARFVGNEFLDDIAEFLTRLSGMLGGMKERASRVQDMLRRPDMGFIIVTSPDARAIDEALAFCERLRQSEMAQSALVVNRLHPRREGPDDLASIRQAVQAALSLPSATVERLAMALLQAHRDMQALALADEAELERLADHCGPDIPLIRVPLFDEDIHDMAGLSLLVHHLGSPEKY